MAYHFSLLLMFYAVALACGDLCWGQGSVSCDIHTHTPARKSSTNFQLYYFVIQICYTNWLGHGHGYEWHSLAYDLGFRV